MGISIPMGLSTVIALALIIQFVVERLKAPISERYRAWVVPLISFILSIILTLSCQIGFLASIGIELDLKVVDYILTGFIISGGSTLVNELIKVLQNVKETLQFNNVALKSSGGSSTPPPVNKSEEGSAAEDFTNNTNS
jgi:hypothetical protein